MHEASDLKVAEAAGALPAEVDAQALIQWLWSVRVRMALGVTRTARSTRDLFTTGLERKVWQNIMHQHQFLRVLASKLVAGHLRSAGSRHTKGHACSTIQN